MNNMELETDIEALDMEMGDITIHYCPVIPNPEGEPTAELKTADIEGTIYKIVDEEARTELENKVDKVEGKGLSSNDYSDEDKAKLDSVENGAEVNVQSDWDENDSSKDDFIKNKPTKLSDFDNDEGFIDKTVDNLDNYYKKAETYTQSEVNSALSGKVDNSTLDNYYTKTETDTALGNKVDKVQGKGLSANDFTDTLKDKLDGIEAEANKTVVDNSVTATSTNPVESKAIYNLLNDLLPEAEETGNPIAISNASGFNAKALTIDMLPIQAGSGTPSPSNPRLISGRNSLDITVNGNTETVALGDTVYGGSWDVVNGGTIVTNPESTRVKISSLSWTYQDNFQRFVTGSIGNVIELPPTNSDKLDTFACECYNYKDFSHYQNGDICVSTSGNMFVKDSNYTDVTTWLNAVGNFYISYPLKTPQTISTPATSISLNKGNNTLSTSGDNMDLKYSTTISNPTSLTMARPSLGMIIPTIDSTEDTRLLDNANIEVVEEPTETE